MKLSESKTLKNLAQAYAGECQARARYEFIEYGARMQGYNALAEVVDKVVYNEFNHARMFYTKIQDASDQPIENIEIDAGYPFKEKWDLVENLRLAAQDEEHEIKIYNNFAKIAEKEGFSDIAQLFKMTANVENCHKMLFCDLYNQMKSKTLYKKDKPIKWKCAGCGYEETGKSAPKECPLCKAKQGFFMLNLCDEPSCIKDCTKGGEECCKENPKNPEKCAQKNIAKNKPTPKKK